MTPLILAVTHVYHAVIKVLLDKGANVHTKDSSGYTALHYAEHSWPMVRLLREPGHEHGDRRGASPSK